MPAKGSYSVTSTSFEQQQQTTVLLPASASSSSRAATYAQAGKDASFKACLTALLVFIAICLLIILITLPWRFGKEGHGGPLDKQKNEAGSTDFLHGGKRTTTTVERPVHTPPPAPTHSNHRPTPTTTEIEIEISGIDYETDQKSGKLRASASSTTLKSTDETQDLDVEEFSPRGEGAHNAEIRASTSEATTTAEDTTRETAQQNHDGAVPYGFSSMVTDSTTVSDSGIEQQSVTSGDVQ